MRVLIAAGLLALLVSAAFGQRAAFDVASVKASLHPVGPDDNNQLTFSPVGVVARNVTLRRLVAVAYQLQLAQVSGSSWLDQNEYEIEAKASGPVDTGTLAVMLQNLLAERFLLKQHLEMRKMRSFDLVVAKTGPMIQPSGIGEKAGRAGGWHFHGDMRQLADLIAVQVTIPAAADQSRPAVASGRQAPVLDKTGLAGPYDFDVDLKPEAGADGLALWQRFLQDQLGLRLNNGSGEVQVIVVDDALRVPMGN